MPKYQHDNFGDVMGHIFAKGVITAVDSDNDLADVTVEGYQNGVGTPLFYHCTSDSEEQPNGSIAGAAAAFSVDDEVIVMLEVGGPPVRIVGFVDGIKSCGEDWVEEWDSSFCGNHIWTERVSYYNDWKGMNGIYYCDTAPTIETSVSGGVLNHSHENAGPTNRDPDTHLINIHASDTGDLTNKVRVVFKFSLATLTGTPKYDYDDRYIRIDLYFNGGVHPYYVAYEGSGSPTIYTPGIEYNILLDGGDPVDISKSGAVTGIRTRTRRLVTAEYSMDYLRFELE